MLSLTWNAPLEAFTDEKQFFNAAGVDGVYLLFIKVFGYYGSDLIGIALIRLEIQSN